MSEAAAWTGRRFFGGDVPDRAQRRRRARGRRARAAAARPGDPLRIAFVGQAVERKGLPVLLRAFEALREQVPAPLTVVGVDAEELGPLLADPRGVDRARQRAATRRSGRARRAHVLCAPSLGGESFGMVLTEAFAAGTPVVASDIAGYRGVVSDGANGVLVPRGRPAGAGRDAARPRARPGAARAPRRARRPLGRALRVAARRRAGARGLRGRDRDPEPRPRPRAPRSRIGLRSADGGPRRPRAAAADARAARPPDGARAPGARSARRVGARRRRASPPPAAPDRARSASAGPHRRRAARLRARRGCSLALALMCFSMVLRAVSWHAILRAALPRARVRAARRAAGHVIGVLMSATLPARLGEPSRALDRRAAARAARASCCPSCSARSSPRRCSTSSRSSILGGVMFTTVDLFTRHTALLARGDRAARDARLVLVAPALLRSGEPSRSRASAAALRRPRGAERVRAGLARLPPPAAGRRRDRRAARRLGVQWVAATCCSSRSASTTTARASARPPPSCSPSTSPPCCRRRRRTSASSRPPASRSSRAPTASAPPTRWLRDHPAGGRGRDRRRHGRAGARQGGRLVARGASARHALGAGLARRPPAVDLALRRLSGERKRVGILGGPAHRRGRGAAAAPRRSARSGARVPSSRR